MFALPLFLTVVCAISFGRDSAVYNKACTVDGRAFSGIRIQYDRALTWSPFKYTEKRFVITNCDLGNAEYEIELPCNSTLFNRTILVPDRIEQLRFTRRKVYWNYTQLQFLPDTLLGAAWTRAGDPDKWTAISPLVADRWRDVYLDSSYRHGELTSTLRTPLFRSPDVLEKNFPKSDAWKEQISPYEKSDHSENHLENHSTEQEKEKLKIENRTNLEEVRKEE